MYITTTFPGIAIYGHSDHETDIEFTSKNRSRTCITLPHFPVLPYMVTPIMKRTSPLNSHQKPVQNMYNTPTFPGIAIYGHSDHQTDITTRFPCVFCILQPN